MERIKPPKEIPADLINSYTMNGKMKLEYCYIDESYHSEHPLVYEKKAVDLLMERIQCKEKFYYRRTDSLLYKALERFKIDGKEVAIMGSITPLYESFCLVYGGKPTTIEYNRIISHDSRLRVMTVDEYDRNPLKFDAAFSISSFEHDGLGRYGDTLNPDGDLDAMKKMETVLKPKGLFFVSVPVGNDTLVWNACRVYGKFRLPKLLQGWKLLHIFTSKVFFDLQPIFILENSDSDGRDCNAVFRNMLIKSLITKTISVALATTNQLGKRTRPVQ